MTPQTATGANVDFRNGSDAEVNSSDVMDGQVEMPGFELNRPEPSKAPAKAPKAPAKATGAKQEKEAGVGPAIAMDKTDTCLL